LTLRDVSAPAKHLAQQLTTCHWCVHWQSGMHVSKHVCLLRADILNACC